MFQIDCFAANSVLLIDSCSLVPKDILISERVCYACLHEHDLFLLTQNTQYHAFWFKISRLNRHCFNKFGC